MMRTALVVLGLLAALVAGSKDDLAAAASEEADAGILDLLVPDHGSCKSLLRSVDDLCETLGKESSACAESEKHARVRRCRAAAPRALDRNLWHSHDHDKHLSLGEAVDAQSLAQQISACELLCPGACPVGFECGECNANGQRQCNVCPDGKYSQQGVATCQDCPAGKASGAGSGGCSTCPDGYTSAAGDPECTKEVPVAVCNTSSIAAPPPPPAPWLGAWNETFADNIPGQNGTYGDPDNAKSDTGSYTGCLTIVNVTSNNAGATGVLRNNMCCTSCPAHKAFVMDWHQTRAGHCRDYTTTPFQKCIKLHENNNNDAFNSKAKLCTKVTLIEATFNVNSLPTGTGNAYPHFLSVKGMGNRAVAKCAVRKETVCDDTGGCQVKKQVKCKEVCKMTAWSTSAAVQAGGSWYDSCDASKCDGVHGSLPCRETTMMV